MFKSKTVGIVVPAFNEEDHIGKTLDNIPDFVDRVYVVDDASTDTTPQIISSYDSLRICYIRHKENKGVGGAITTGYKKALEENIDITAVMAGDDQMDPDYLPSILIPVIEGKADYAKATRKTSREHMKGMPKFRYLGNWVLEWLTKIASGYYHVKDPQHGYAAISKETLQKIDLDGLYPYYGYCNDILVKLSVISARIVEVPMPSRYQGEKSKIKYSRYIPKVSLLLARSFLWRMKMKYLRHRKTG